MLGRGLRHEVVDLDHLDEGILFDQVDYEKSFLVQACCERTLPSFTTLEVHAIQFFPLPSKHIHLFSCVRCTQVTSAREHRCITLADVVNVFVLVSRDGRQMRRRQSNISSLTLQVSPSGRHR
jgi:hypothetical protein